MAAALSSAGVGVAAAEGRAVAKPPISVLAEECTRCLGAVTPGATMIALVS